MTKFTLKECAKQGIPPENIVPSDLDLWETTSRIYGNPGEKSKLISVYESLGGKFVEKLPETSPPAAVDDDEDDLDEDFDFSPLSGSKSARRRLKHLKNRDPYTVGRMTGWN